MIIIKDVLISDDVVNEQFMCNLNACKGACCWEGDWGAPLEEEELQVLDNIYPIIKPFLTKEGKAAIREQGKYTYYEEPEEFGTPLIKNGACAYMTFDRSGTAQCGIELAHRDGLIDFKKPISCHLYPIRVEVQKEVNFEAMNYDVWDICSAACVKGKKHKMPVYKFAKDALIRKYGEDFYEELDAAAQFISSKQENK